MDFQEAERRFQNLENAYHTGQCDHLKYQEAMAQLQVVDLSGTTWRMQAHTGAWHYLREGKWVQGSPYPGFPSQVAPPPRSAPPAGPTPMAPKERAVSRPVLVLAVGALAVLAFCVGAAGAGYYLYSQNRGDSTRTSGTVQQQTAAPAAPTQLAQTSFEETDVTAAKADGSPAVDSRGVSLTAPVGTLGEGVAAQMTALEVKGPLSEALASGYDVDTPLYALTAQGQNDGTGRSTLSFPAASPQSRVLAIIDREYLAVLNVLPENGQLAVQPLLPPAEAKDLKPSGSAGPRGTVYYTVITPKAGGTSAVPSGIQMARWRKPQAGAGVGCMPTLNPKVGITQLCRMNAAGTVQVLFRPDLALTSAEADLVAQEVETRMNSYAGLGFTAAKLSPSAPMQVIVTGSSGDPLYQVSNGVIYLPLDIAKDMPGKGKALWHEMGHWIQDVAYNMTWAFWNGNKRWWMEVAAENMVMLVAPDYIQDNMSTYGTITSGDNSLALSNSPYQWPSDFYVHAQLVKVNLCDAGCLLSQAGFIEAINKGTYPYDDSGAQEKLSANLDDYARYLLGSAPLAANTAISLAAVQSQDSYGQSVSVSKSSKGDFWINHNGNAPQLVKKTKGGQESLEFQVALQKDGVYPLEITSGMQGKYAGLPAVLTIAPGTPFYYRLDGGEPQFSDGSQETILGPIHVDMGISNLRLVAFSKTGGQTFSAHLDVIDLKGVWVIQLGDKVSDSVSCVSSSESITAHPEGVSQVFSLITNIITAAGDMYPDATGLSLDWALAPARLPPDVNPEKFTFKGTALIAPDRVEYQSQLEIPEPESTSQALPDGVAVPSLAIIVFLPAVSLSRRVSGRRGRILALGLMVLLAGLLLSSCIGIGFHGGATGDVKITGLQYLGGTEKITWTAGAPVTGKPIWAFTQGTATYQVTAVMTASSEDAEGNTTTDTSTCTGPVTYKITGGVYPDVEVILPKNP